VIGDEFTLYGDPRYADPRMTIQVKTCRAKRHQYYGTNRCPACKRAKDRRRSLHAKMAPHLAYLLQRSLERDPAIDPVMRDQIRGTLHAYQVALDRLGR
jgi:hypothetical protein